jgi:hypothetical protein
MKRPERGIYAASTLAKAKGFESSQARVNDDGEAA